MDPDHISGAVGKGDMKGSNRVTSFHYYPATSIVRFSRTMFADVEVPESVIGAAQSSSAASGVQSAAQLSAPEQGSGWVWDDKAEKYRYWNGSAWVWQEQK